MSSSVVAASDCPETFLACCVPDLEFDGLSVLLNCANFKVNTNGAYVAIQVRIILST